MPRAVWLVLALVLSVPALASGWTLLTTSCFLAEFLSDRGWRPLSAITPPPAVRPLPAGIDGRPLAVDLHVAPGFSRRPGLVLVHGLAREGKNDPRLRQAASLLARAGWAVAVPTVEGLTVLRLRPEDADPVVGTLRALVAAGYHPAAVVGVSLGSAPALIAAADPRVASLVSAVLALGGYASTVELLRYTLTGAYGFHGVAGRRPTNEAAIAEFARANAELVGPAGRRLVENRDPRAVDGLVAALPAGTRELLAELAPEGALGRLRAPLFLIHGRDDPAVPFTETLRLDEAARAAGRQVRTIIVGAVGHVDPEDRAGLRDLARLWAALYAFSLSSATVTSDGRAP